LRLGTRHGKLARIPLNSSCIARKAEGGEQGRKYLFLHQKERSRKKGGKKRFLTREVDFKHGRGLKSELGQVVTCYRRKKKQSARAKEEEGKERKSGLNL